jgi:hypothetical protein
MVNFRKFKTKRDENYFINRNDVLGIDWDGRK